MHQHDLTTNTAPLNHHHQVNSTLHTITRVPTTQPLLLSVIDPPFTTTMDDSNTTATAAQSPPGIPKPQSLLEEDEPTLTQDLTQEPEEDEDDEDNHEQSSHAKRCLLDFVEWWCYKLISASTTSEIKTAEAELLKAMEHFGSSQCDFGRLANRINIAAFSLDVALLGSSAANTAATLSHSSSAASAPINNISLDQHWNMIGEELILLKSKLLRKDANADTVLLTSDEERQALVDAIPSPQKEKSSKFQKHYQHAALLVKVQTALSIFHKKLTNQLQPKNLKQAEGQAEQEQQGEEEANHTSTQTQSKKKAIREAIEEYETQINQLFTAGNLKDKQHQKEDEEDDNGNDNDNASVSSSDVRELPQELAGFLLKDLYQSSKNQNQTISDSASTSSSSSSNNNNNNNSNSNPNSTTTALAERLLKHVNSILKGTGRYSQSTCQKTIRKLLKEWHDSVLEQPTLVALGYGSSASSRATPQQNRAIAEEDALLRRLSNCGNTNNNIDASHLQGYLSDSDVDEHQQQQQQQQQQHANNTNKKKKSSSKAAAVAKKNKFVPIKWVDSDEEDDDTIWDPQQQQQQQQPVSSSRSASPSPSPTPPHRNKKKRAIDKLYSDSEEDPEESIITISSTSPSPSPPPPPPPPRPSSSRGRADDRRRTTRSRSRSRSPTNHRGRSSRDDDLKNNKSSGSSSFKRSSSPSPPPQQRCSRNRGTSNNSSRTKREAIKREQEEERSNRRMPVKLSRREKEAILDGAKLYGVGRWTIVRKRAPGRVLDKLSVQTIKAAYEQIITTTKQQQQRLKRQRDFLEEEEQEHQREEKRRKKYHHQHHQHSKEQNKHQQHQYKKQQQRSHYNSGSKNKGTTTHVNRRR